MNYKHLKNKLLRETSQVNISEYRIAYRATAWLMTSNFYLDVLHPVVCIRSGMWGFRLRNDVSVVFTIIFLSRYMFRSYEHLQRMLIPIVHIST
jgi:hypothetical protein